MPVVFRHSADLDLNVVTYSGSVTLDELSALTEFQGAQSALLTYDTLSVIEAGADFRTIALARIDDVFVRYRALFEPLNIVILRRGAWVCQSPAAQPHLDHWLGEPDLRKSLAKDIRQFHDIASAAEWLVLDPKKVAAVLSGEGFEELARFDLPAAGLRR